MTPTLSQLLSARPKAMRGAGEINSHDWMVFDYLIKKLRTKEPADAR